MGIEKMNFGRAHHGGIPTAEPEVRAINSTPVAETTKQGNTMPPTGTIDNFSRSSVVNMVPDANYLRIVARAEQAWNHRME